MDCFMPFTFGSKLKEKEAEINMLKAQIEEKEAENQVLKEENRIFESTLRTRTKELEDLRRNGRSKRAVTRIRKELHEKKHALQIESSMVDCMYGKIRQAKVKYERELEKERNRVEILKATNSKLREGRHQTFSKMKVMERKVKRLENQVKQLKGRKRSKRHIQEQRAGGECASTQKSA